MQGIRREIPAYADLIYRPPPKPAEIPTPANPKKIHSDIDALEQDINMDFEENSPYQEGVISEIYKRLDKSYFQELPEVQGLVNIDKLVQKFLSKQASIDKNIKT